MQESSKAHLLLVTILLVLPMTLAAERLQRQALSPRSTDGSVRLQPSRVEQVSAQGQRFTLQYDDGEADNGYGYQGDFYDAVMLFSLPAGSLPADLVEMTVCLSRLGTQRDLELDLTVWAADGPGQTPGSLLEVIPVVASGVSLDLAGTYYTYDLADLGIVIDEPEIFLGLGWEPATSPEFFVCADHDGSSVQSGFDMIDLDDTWFDLTEIDADYTALMVRGTFEREIATGPCVPGEETLCLSDGRFRVEVGWQRPQGEAGFGQARLLTDDTGYFWFFDAANVEMVIKVLDACAVNDRYWVFAGGLTDVAVDVTVTDSQTGEVWTASNPQQTPFQPIQDTAAFATCP